jgi:Fe2+ or Zn2+ uptake regulation protein
MNMEQTTYDYLLSFGVKPSVQRMAIMDYLLTHRTHPSIDEIYMALNGHIPTLSKTTVYNTLRLLVEQGAAQMLTIDDRNACFDADITPHSHFLCKRCNRIFDWFHDEPSHELASPDAKGFQVDEVHRYYRGVCPDCLKKMSELTN